MNTRYLFGLPLVTLQVRSQEVEALLDTGFDGWLMLPNSMIKDLNLKYVGQTDYELADGEVVESQLYEAELDWLGEEKKISVVSTPSDLSLLGMGLLANAKTTIRPSKSILQIEKEV